MTAEKQRGEKRSLFAPLSRVISAERFSTYMTAAGHDEERALRLYLWNIALAEAFHGPIQAVEVSLRNCVAQALTEEFGPQWWKAVGFRSLVDARQADDVDAVLQKVAKTGDAPGAGQIVSGLSFGFWVAMLNARYNPTLWSRRLRGAFPDLPATEDRESLRRRADAIRLLRNRIAHHEPILARNTSKDHADVMAMLRWMSPAMHDWIRPSCRVPEIMRNKP